MCKKLLLLNLFVIPLLCFHARADEVADVFRNPSKWRDNHNHEITAKVISTYDGKVRFRTTDRTVFVPFSNLVPEDQQRLLTANLLRLTRRTWVDSSGIYTVRADLVMVRDGQAFLKEVDDKEGKSLVIPLSRLSDADLRYIHRALGVVVADIDGLWQSADGDVFMMKRQNGGVYVEKRLDDGTMLAIPLICHGPIARAGKDGGPVLAVAKDWSLELSMDKVHRLRKMSRDEREVFLVGWESASRMHDLTQKERELRENHEREFRKAEELSHFWGALTFFSAIANDQDIFQASRQTTAVTEQIIQPFKPFPNPTRNSFPLAPDARFPSNAVLSKSDFHARVMAACAENTPKYTAGTVLTYKAVAFAELYLTIAGKSVSQEQYLAIVRATARRLLADIDGIYAANLPGFPECDAFRVDFSHDRNSASHVDDVMDGVYAEYAEALKPFQDMTAEEKEQFMQIKEQVLIPVADVLAFLQQHEAGKGDHELFRRADPVTRIITSEATISAPQKFYSVNDLLGPRGSRFVHNAIDRLTGVESSHVEPAPSPDPPSAIPAEQLGGNVTFSGRVMYEKTRKPVARNTELRFPVRGSLTNYISVTNSFTEVDGSYSASLIRGQYYSVWIKLDGGKAVKLWEGTVENGQNLGDILIK